jgi:hypothetical protein
VPKARVGIKRYNQIRLRNPLPSVTSITNRAAAAYSVITQATLTAYNVSSTIQSKAAHNKKADTRKIDVIDPTQLRPPAIRAGDKILVRIRGGMLKAKIKIIEIIRFSSNSNRATKNTKSPIAMKGRLIRIRFRSNLLVK